MKNIKVLGIDLAKDVFQLQGTDAKGKRVLKKRFRPKAVEQPLPITEEQLSKNATCDFHRITLKPS